MSFDPQGLRGVVRKRNSAAYAPGVSRRKEQLCFWRRITRAKGDNKLTRSNLDTHGGQLLFAAGGGGHTIDHVYNTALISVTTELNAKNIYWFH